jgi:hypothetical protein
LNCPTQIIELTSLPKYIDYTGVKGSHSANKKIKLWIQQRSKGATEGPLVWEHRTVRCTPDSVRCTRGLQLELATFGNFQRHSRYNSPDCPVYTGQCPVRQGEAASGTRQLRELQRLVRYNSPDMSGVHRTVRCNSGATAISAPTATCDALIARAARAEVRRAHTGAPDKEQCMSGVHRTLRRAHKSEVPMVRIQRH